MFRDQRVTLPMVTFRAVLAPAFLGSSAFGLHYLGIQLRCSGAQQYGSGHNRQSQAVLVPMTARPAVGKPEFQSPPHDQVCFLTSRIRESRQGVVPGWCYLLGPEVEAVMTTAVGERGSVPARNLATGYYPRTRPGVPPGSLGRVALRRELPATELPTTQGLSTFGRQE